MRLIAGIRFAEPDDPLVGVQPHPRPVRLDPWNFSSFKSERNRTASIFVFFTGPTPSAAACACRVQSGSVATPLRRSLRVIRTTVVYAE